MISVFSIFHLAECDLQCLNGGTPELDTCTPCSCPIGYTGNFCEEDIDECSVGDPCTGGGECTNTMGGYSCSCDVGLTGKNCNIDINECLFENPCMNSGSCFNEPFGSFHCMCAENWAGPTCQECAVENCRRCEVGSVPARCEREQCEEGYHLDADGKCGKYMSTSCSKLNIVTAAVHYNFKFKTCFIYCHWSLAVEYLGRIPRIIHWSISLSTDCSIENCESCSGTPAVCTGCNPGYQLDSNSLTCGMLSCI